MFKSPEARFAVRAFLFGAFAVANTLFVSIPIDVQDAETAVLAGFIAALSYAGIGAVSKTVEPNVGRVRAE